MGRMLFLRLPRDDARAAPCPMHSSGDMTYGKEKLAVAANVCQRGILGGSVMVQIDRALHDPARHQWTPTPEQLAQWTADFERDGYVVLRNLLSPEEITAMHEQIAQAFDEPDPIYP